MRSLIISSFIALLSVGLVPAQTFRGPTEAYTFDAPSESLRAVEGFPGSATFGLPLVTGVESGWVAPNETYAIAIKNGSSVFVSGLNSAKVSTAAIPGIYGQPEGVQWSSDGTLAVLYSFSGKWMQTVSDLPKAPHANPHQDLALLGGTFSAISTDTSGKHIAIAISGESGGVYLSSAGQDFIPLAKMANPIALSFSENGESLYALDGTALKLAVITLSNWSTQTVSLAGLENPFAIKAGHDTANHPLVLVASGKDRRIGVYNPATEKMQSTFRLSFEPTGIESFGRSSFVIAARSKAADPLWLFTTAPRTAVYFVPATPAAATLANKELQ